jgi:CheY-like chemotaxis protein
VDTFAKPKFCEQITSLAGAYGPLEFWIQNISLTANPDATWRALMILGARSDPRLADLARPMLAHPDSRVRSWTCFFLGQAHDEQSLQEIYNLTGDPANRVRVHAWQAIQAIVGPEEDTHHLAPLREPRESNILISDDSENNQKVLGKLLEDRGYQTLSALTEAETLHMAREYLPQAILTDNQKYQDNLSGINMTWDLTRIPELRETLIFMLSQDPIEPVFLWYGGDYYLRKTMFTPQKLISAVDAYLLH